MKKTILLSILLFTITVAPLISIAKSNSSVTLRNQEIREAITAEKKRVKENQKEKKQQLEQARRQNKVQFMNRMTGVQMDCEKKHKNNSEAIRTCIRRALTKNAQQQAISTKKAQSKCGALHTDGMEVQDCVHKTTLDELKAQKKQKK